VSTDPTLLRYVEIQEKHRKVEYVAGYIFFGSAIVFMLAGI